MSEVNQSTQDLLRRQEMLTRELEAHQHSLADYQRMLASITGTGSAAEGAIVATVDARHRLVDLTLEPPALRLGSIKALRDEIVAAVQAAHDSLDEQLAEEFGVTDMHDFLDAMPEVVSLLPEELVEQLRKQPDSEPQPVPQRAQSWSDWNLDD